MANVDHDQEGGPALIDRESFGVNFGLPAGFHHSVIPALGPADTVAFLKPLGFRRQHEFAVSVLGFAPLFRLQDEAAPLVEVDPAVAGGAVRVLEFDVPLENVGVLRDVGH